MMNNINIETIESEFFNSKEIISKYKTMIDECGYLKKGLFNKTSLKGIFSENLWVYESYISKHYVYIDFGKLEQFKFLGLTDEYINLIKCWVADTLIIRAYENESEELNLSARIRSSYKHLVEFIEVSNNFSFEFINDENGSRFDNYFFNLGSDSKIKNYTKDILSFISFIEPKFIEDKSAIGIEYIDKLNYFFEVMNIQKKSRELPNSKDILLFSNYLDLFFNDDNILDDLKKYFYPIKLWWKITNIIPLRASEFCLKIKRNCLIEYNNEYFIKINRIKRRENLGKDVLPVLTELKVPKEIYDLVKDYIDETKVYGESETLISYPAILEYRKKLKEESFFKFENMSSMSKSLPMYFTNISFSLLLYSFYNIVIKGIYKDDLIKDRVRPNDTRHFAFTSLILQGIAPEKIAILGGHKNLKTLDNYTNSNNIYIDSEVITIINQSLSEGTINRKAIKRIIFNKDKECPKPLSQCFETEIYVVNFGYCTENLNYSIPCGDNECYHCPKWWCSPIEDNYNKLFFIITNKIKKEENKLNRDIEFIRSLFEKVNIKNIDGHIIIDKEIKEQFRRKSLSINKNSQNLIELKSQLINTKDTCNIINLLDDINNYIVKDSINYLDKGENNGKE